MKLLLMKCGICDTWYKPECHNGHCYHCSAMPMKVGKNRVKYFHIHGNIATEVVRGIPRYAVRNIRTMAQILAGD